MVYYYLPGLFEFFPIYVEFMNMFKHEKYKFRKCEVGAIYGAPRAAIWNGGRLRAYTTLDVNSVYDWSIEENIPCSLTYTNSILEENHLHNIFCNELTRLFEDEKNSITIHSPLLEEYIREKYPKYKMVSSTTKCIRDLTVVEQELEKYDRVVLDYNFNKDFDSLKAITQKDKCELLVNAVCFPDCQYRAAHYKYISECSLGISHDEDFACDAMIRPLHIVLTNPNTITVDQIFKIYEPLGFQHFKIEGRTARVEDFVETLVYYTVLPEFQLEIRQRLGLIL